MIDNLKLAISENDMMKARKILKDELLERNYPHEIFKDALELAVDYDVFEKHDNEILSEEPEKWTQEYLEELKKGLNNNFSKERFVKAYYVSKKINNEANSNDKSSDNKKKNGKKIACLAGGIAVVSSIALLVCGAILSNKKIKK